MTSTEDAKVLLIDLEDSSTDSGQATPRQTQSAGSPLYEATTANNPNHSHSTATNYGALDSTGVTRNQTSSLAGYRPGANPDGTHAINMDSGRQNSMDNNVYQQKKNFTQGMMDLALLSANANQLRYVIESCQKHPFFWINLVLISISIFIQIVVGLGLILKSQYSINNQNDYHTVKRINNLVSIGIFVITIVNVMISAFNIAEITES